MGKPCIAFEMEDVHVAFEHMQPETVIDYGEEAYGHDLQPWNEGGRRLCRCKACGGYFLVQSSEYHSFDGDDSYYIDWYPVSGPEEADQLNRLYDGWDLEFNFPKRFMSCTNLHWYWRGGTANDDQHRADG